jgi:hypothetical protein
MLDPDHNTASKSTFYNNVDSINERLLSLIVTLLVSLLMSALRWLFLLAFLLL